VKALLRMMRLMTAQQVIHLVTVRLKTMLWMTGLMMAQQVVCEGNTAGDASNDSLTGGTLDDSPSDNDDGQSEMNVQTHDLEKAVKTGWVNSFVIILTTYGVYSFLCSKSKEDCQEPDDF
jgi:hypothetical protein